MKRLCRIPAVEASLGAASLMEGLGRFRKVGIRETVRLETGMSEL